MQDKKTMEIIKAIKNMSDHEAVILEVFISGFRAGKQVSDQKIRNEPTISQAAKPSKYSL